jgi:DNA polymerase-3 subunit delta
VKVIKDDIKKKSFRRVYLIYGDERFLINYYTRALTDAVVPQAERLMNHDVFEGKNIPISQITDAANTFPMFNDYRLVTVRDSGLFAMKKKGEAEARRDDADAMSAYLADVPPSTVLLFVEADTDKRTRLFKQVEKLGHAVNCAKPSPAELNKWVVNIFSKHGKTITPATAAALIHSVSGGMTAIDNEAEKLCAYAGGRDEITPDDIAAVVSPTLEARVFKLVDAAVSGNKAEAVKLYGDMLLLKESPFGILAMIVRQYRMILQCKAALEQNMRRYEIISEFGIRDFVVDECIEQGRRLTMRQTVAALKACRDMEIRIKSGLMDAETGVELLVLGIIPQTPNP